LAAALKFSASGSVQPGYRQDMSSRAAAGSKFAARGSVQPRLPRASAAPPQVSVSPAIT
jgi:hypothetical protein